MTTMRLRPTGLWAFLLFVISLADTATAAITIDAGLTPAEGRWMVRTQLRIMSRQAPAGMGDASMDRLMVPLVVVHGLRPGLTVGMRQVFDSRTMTMNGMETTRSGLGDLYIFAKYKFLRINTRSYTLGVAPVLGVEPPTGADGISSESWDLTTGLYVSGRAGTWALDINLAHNARGIAGVAAGGPEPGDERAVDLALSRQIPLGDSGRVALAPVLEVTWLDTSPNASQGVDLPDSGESVLNLAPGMKYTVGDLIIEGLVRFPVVQDQEGRQLEAGPMALLGVRRMF